MAATRQVLGQFHRGLASTGGKKLKVQKGKRVSLKGARPPGAGIAPGAVSGKPGQPRV